MSCVGIWPGDRLRDVFRVNAEIVPCINPLKPELNPILFAGIIKSSPFSPR